MVVDNPNYPIPPRKAAPTSAAVDHAMAVMERVVYFPVPATGGFIAEIPGHEWDFWALGKTKERAAIALAKKIAKAPKAPQRMDEEGE